VIFVESKGSLANFGLEGSFVDDGCELERARWGVGVGNGQLYMGCKGD
jgi:hypothetical protein